MAYVKFKTADAAQKYQLNRPIAGWRIKVQSYLMQPEYLEIVFQQRF